ncbi:MAG TPA: PAS domain-containing protein, partial [Ignavibacteriaceae bacterium]|nr:PAS domain-containing protein [Ignavibacteriaceae bacterium]
MFVTEQETYFDSPVRSTVLEIKSRTSRLSKNSIIVQMLESFPELVVILDSNRQIVAYNKKAEELLRKGNEEIIGQRLGEAFRCIHAFETPGGCGTSSFCSECGAGKS